MGWRGKEEGEGRKGGGEEGGKRGEGGGCHQIHLCVTW